MRKSKTEGRRKKGIEFVEGTDNVFYDLGFGKDAVNLLLRADLMSAITDVFDKRNWSNLEAARALAVKETRISELRHGRISKFSVDLLLKYLARLGKRVDITVKDIKQVA